MNHAQEKVRAFCEAHGLQSPSEHRALDLVSEIGEVAKEILKTTDYGRMPRSERAEVAPEVGDAFFSFVALANELNVDLDAALNSALAKYETRLAKGSAGSKQDSR